MAVPDSRDDPRRSPQLMPVLFGTMRLYPVDTSRSTSTCSGKIVLIGHFRLTSETTPNRHLITFHARDIMAGIR